MGENEEIIRTALEALKAADNALSEYACHIGERAPCIRTKDQCAYECGKPAGDALLKITPVIAELEAALDPLARADAALNSGGMAQSHESPPPASGADDGL